MSKRRPNPPSAQAIAEYWDTRGLEESDPCHYVKSAWNPMVDVGEPSCQGCGCWNSEWDERPIGERWNHAHGLEKAHIVPLSSGGSNEPSNYLMLCRFCHFDFDSEIYITSMDEFDKVIKWLSNRPKQKWDKIDSIIKSHIKNNNYDNESYCQCLIRGYEVPYRGNSKHLEDFLDHQMDVADLIYSVKNEGVGNLWEQVAKDE